MAEYIDKQKAIDAVTVRNLHPGIVNSLQSLIVDIPAADVAPVRHGRWKFKEDKAWVGNGKYWCSVCRYGFASGAYHEVDEFKFCPMCGSKMDGGEK